MERTRFSNSGVSRSDQSRQASKEDRPPLHGYCKDCSRLQVLYKLDLTQERSKYRSRQLEFHCSNTYR